MPANTMDWRDLSSVCFGLVANRRIDATKFNAEMFTAPYDAGFKAFFAGATKTRLSSMLGPALEEANMAQEGVSDASLTEVEWAKNLLAASKQYAAGKQLENVSRRLVRGEPIASPVIIETAVMVRDLANPDGSGLKVSSTIDLENFTPVMPCGYPPIDDNLGGIPKSGNILIMGTTGVGKSLFTQMFLGHFLDKYPEKRVAIWSLEMTNEQYLYRGLRLYPLFKRAHEQGRILVSDTTTSISDIGIEAATAGVDMIVVDYIDYLVNGEGSESKYAEIYVAMNSISRTLNIPFMMLLQPNRSSYVSGVPQMWHARYSGMAENVSAQFWVLYEPKSEDDMNGDFVFEEDSMYIVAHKQRFGYLQGKPGPGAIVIPKTSAVWGDGGSTWMKKGAVPLEHKVTKRRRGNNFEA